MQRCVQVLGVTAPPRVHFTSSPHTTTIFRLQHTPAAPTPAATPATLTPKATPVTFSTFLRHNSDLFQTAIPHRLSWDEGLGCASISHSSSHCKSTSYTRASRIKPQPPQWHFQTDSKTNITAAFFYMNGWCIEAFPRSNTGKVILFLFSSSGSLQSCFIILRLKSSFFFFA